MNAHILCSLLLLSVTTGATQCMQKEKEPKKHQFRFRVSKEIEYLLFDLTEIYLLASLNTEILSQKPSETILIKPYYKKYKISPSERKCGLNLFKSLRTLRKDAKAVIDFSSESQDFYIITISTPLSREFGTKIEEIAKNPLTTKILE